MANDRVCAGGSVFVRACESVRGVSFAVQETSSSSTLTGLSFFACFGIVAVLASCVPTPLDRAIYMYFKHILSYILTKHKYGYEMSSQNACARIRIWDIMA